MSSQLLECAVKQKLDKNVFQKHTVEHYDNYGINRVPYKFLVIREIYTKNSVFDNGMVHCMRLMNRV